MKNFDQDCEKKTLNLTINAIKWYLGDGASPLIEEKTVLTKRRYQNPLGQLLKQFTKLDQLW